MLPWDKEGNQKIKRKLQENSGWRFLQGSGIVRGTLLGGCMDVLEFLKGTEYWVPSEEWEGKIMFLETSEIQMSPMKFRWMLWNYAASGILKNINGLILARPYDNKYWKEYDEILVNVLKEEHLEKLPVITGMDFGHTCPTFTIPYGVAAEIDCIQKTFSILESPFKD